MWHWRTTADRLGGALRPDFWRDHWRAIVYLAFGGAMFGLFAAENFPYPDVLSNELARLGLQLSWNQETSQLPFGEALEDVSLTLSGFPGGEPLIQCSRLSVAPALGSLILGQLGLRLSAELYGGFLSAWASRRGSAVALQMDASRLRLESYRGLGKFGAAFAGSLSASGQALVMLDGSGVTHGKLTITASGLSLRIAHGMAPIRLGELNATVEVDDQTLRVKRLDSHGADLGLDAMGIIRLAQPLSASTMDLKLRLQPTAAGAEQLRFVLRMLPHPPGFEPYILRGPILSPSVI